MLKSLGGSNHLKDYLRKSEPLAGPPKFRKVDFGAPNEKESSGGSDSRKNSWIRKTEVLKLDLAFHIHLARLDGLFRRI